MIIDKIKKDRMLLRKDPDKKLEVDLLTTIYSDITLEEKNSGVEKLANEKTIAILNKYKKNATENLNLVKEDKEKTADFEKELNLILNYLPKQLSNDELKEIITKVVVEGNNNIGAIMGHLKQNYNGQYNPKSASAIAKEIL